MSDKLSPLHGIIKDPTWLPHTFNSEGDQILFIRVSTERRNSVPFLSGDWLRDCERVALPAVNVRQSLKHGTFVPLHFIFHTAFCGSTLLVRALDASRAATGLVEPAILLNHHFRISRAAEEAEQERLRISLRLLGRRMGDLGAVVAKPSCVANPIAPHVLRNSPASRAVLLSSDLRTFLFGVAKRGPQGAAWGQRILQSCRDNLPVNLDFNITTLDQLTGLQAAALAWVCRRLLFDALVTTFGPDRVLPVRTEDLFKDPLGAVARVAGFFGRHLSQMAVDQLARSDTFNKHSKEIGRPFNRHDRELELRTLAAGHGSEVDAVARWIEREASARVALTN